MSPDNRGLTVPFTAKQTYIADVWHYPNEVEARKVVYNNLGQVVKNMTQITQEQHKIQISCERFKSKYKYKYKYTVYFSFEQFKNWIL